MNNIIEVEQQRLHELVWRPDKWMHASWWRAFELSQWQQVYQQSPSCQGAIDNMILRRKDLSFSPILKQLEPRQYQILALETRLMKLFLAMGILVLACPDYLVLRRYRCRLTDIFGEQGCEQLLAIGTFYHSPSQVIYSEEDFIEKAQGIGLSWWYAEKTDCVVYHALKTTFPNYPPQEAPRLGSIFPWLLRIGRFL